MSAALATLVSCGHPRSSERERPTPEKDPTGAVTTISPTDADRRATRVEELLRGRVAGLEVVRLPNGDYTLRIRGQRSLRGAHDDDEPLLIIDDVPVPSGSLAAALAGIAPRDVARIDVLKDAAATSIYGARGANGVIIIKTQRAP